MSLGLATGGSSALLGFGLDLAARAAVLLALALLAWRAVGRTRPAIGSAIGRGAVLALLLLPASARLAPTLPIPLLQAVEPARPVERRAIAAEESMLRDDSSHPVALDLPALAGQPVAKVAARPAAIRPPVNESPRPSPGGLLVDFPSLLVVGYIAVALAMLARLLGSLAAVARVRRSSMPVDDPAWLGLFDRLKGDLGIARPVDLSRSASVGVPAVVGWLRPMILLPDSGPAGNPTAHAEAILLHELAHVRRGDYAWNVLLRVVGAIYWPHPLAWLLARAVAESRERACDAFCVHRMGGPSAYREALLAMAEGLARRPGPALGLAMAGRSRLALRVLEIDRGRAEPRCLPRRPTRLALAALALGSTAIVGPAHLTRAEPSPSPVPIVASQAPAPAVSPAVAKPVPSVEARMPGLLILTAVRPDGRPLAGARVYRSWLGESLTLEDGQVGWHAHDDRLLATDASGRLSIPETDRANMILIMADDCFALANAKGLAASPRVVARPYGRIEGRLVVGDRPKANQRIALWGTIQDESTALVSVSFRQWATTDAEGRFFFDKVVVIPGLRIARQDPPDGPRSVRSLGEVVRVEDGRTSVVTVGGKGRAVVGRVEPPQGWDRPVDFTDRCRIALWSDRPIRPIPLEFLRGRTELDDRGWQDWSATWGQTPEGRAHADARVTLSISLDPDGSFRLDDVPPGDYRASIRVNGAKRDRDPGPFATLATTLSVPPGRSDEPLDLGRLRLKVRAPLKVGDPAPAVVVMTVDGRRLAIPGDFPGKTLLLDLGGGGGTQDRLQIVRLNDVHARFGNDPRFAMVSLLFDPDRPESRAYVAGKGQPWPQAIVGAPSNPISDAYDFDADASELPGSILIGPDGRIVAKGLFYKGIGEAVAAALGLPAPAAKP